MPLNIRMKPGFMYLGTTSNNTTEQVPMPNGGAFTTTFSWQTQKSADGSTVGQQLGRPIATQALTWSRMDCATWWRINQWIEANGMVFFARFFNFNVGQWQTRQFVVLKVTGTPYRPGQEGGSHHGEPMMMQSCSFTVTDLGVVE